MKKLLLFPVLFIIGISYGQNLDAPWMQEINKSAHKAFNKEKKQATFQEIQSAFNKYWETRDPNVKGSGYKPFKRWEYIWENSVDENGYLPTSKDMWSAWEGKNNNASKQTAVTTDLSNWGPIGPFTHTNTDSWSPGQARMNVITVDPNNSAIWYVGAPAGGLWKSTNSGNTWSVMTDNLPQIGVSGIAVDYNNSNIIYIATGDDDAGDTRSAGVFKTVDGGASWIETGLNPNTTPSSMNDIYINPSNSNMLWVATNQGVFKTIDAGVTWTNTLSGNIKDIKIKPTDPNTVYAVTTDTFYKSTNAGDTFPVIATGLPSGSGRMVIDVTPANSSYVYVLAVNTSYAYQGVYRSNDSGTSFSARNTSGPMGSCTQGWYDLAFGVSTTNASEVFIGCLNVWKSSNGANSFTEINSWSNPSGAAYTHADIHMIRSFNGDIFVGSDGGIYRSTNSGASFTDHTGGIQASQFYKVAVSATDVNKMVGGLQDNGGYAYNNGNGNWKNYHGADGMDSAISPSNNNKYYSFIQEGGSLYKSSNAGDSSSGSVNKPGGLTGNWVTPLAMSSSGQLFAGYNRLCKLNIIETGWIQLADLGNPADQIEIAPSDNTRMYIAVDAILKRSDDTGVSVSDVYTFGGNIKGIGVHSTNPDIVWVTTNSAVFKSVDAGVNFVNITGNLPISNSYVFFNDIVHHDGQAQDPIYLATSIGVYRTVTNGTWEPFFNNLPTTIVTDLEINIADNSITAATYGRGIWRSSLPNCTTITATQEISIDGGGFEFMASAGLCTGQSVTFKPTVLTGSSPTYSWSGPNGFSDTNSTITINNLTAVNAGEYTLTINATGTCGTVDYKYIIDIENASQPTSLGVTICSNDTASLSATGSTDYKWYSIPIGGSQLSVGSTFVTPSLTTDTTYYVSGTSSVIVSEAVPSPLVNTAADYDNVQGLIFNTNDEITLESFTMSAVVAGDRIIQVTSSTGAIVATTTVNVPAGESLVTVNFVIPKGDGYTLSIPSGTVQMRRTPTGNGVSYPYTSPSNVVSIVGNTANALEYYYFFYNWNFTSKGGRCESVRTPVQVTVNTVNPDVSDGDTTYSINGGVSTAFNANDTITIDDDANLTLSLPSIAFSGTLLWTAPGGATYNTNTISLLNVQDGGAEEGQWSVSVDFSPNCSTSPQVFNFIVAVNAPLSIDENEFDNFQVYPVPTNAIVVVKSSNDLSKALISLTDVQGRVILNEVRPELVTPYEFKLNLKSLANGTYFLKIKDNQKQSVRKIVKK